ncbi:MAG: mRNA surveillance protein pelota [Candidatus Woesearchaeota archaeon]
MKTLSKNIKNSSGEISLKIESLDDLWQLSRIIETDDFVRSKTERKIKLNAEDERSKNVVKKTITLTLKVEKAGFQEQTAYFRISGITTEAHEDIPKGSHHTLTIKPDSVLAIQKERWLDYQLSIIKEACENKPLNILLILFDREEANFINLHNNKFEVLSQLKSETAKKDLDAKTSRNFYKEILQQILEYKKTGVAEEIIAASPAFWKDYLVNELPQELKKKVITCSCSSADPAAVDEVLKRPELNKVLEQNRNRKDEIILEELLEMISKGLGSYGIDDVKQNIAAGNVKQLIASDSFIKKRISEERFSEVKELFELCEKNGGKIHITSSEQACKKLDGLGGVAGFLRWKTQNS